MVFGFEKKKNKKQREGERGENRQFICGFLGYIYIYILIKNYLRVDQCNMNFLKLLEYRLFDYLFIDIQF